MKKILCAALVAVACTSPRPTLPPAAQTLADEIDKTSAQLAARPGDAGLRRDLGLLHFFAGDRDQATRILADLVAQSPDDVRALWGLAMAYDAALDERAADVYARLADQLPRHGDDPWALAIGPGVARWLDERAAMDGDAAAGQKVAALAAGGVAPSIVAAALDGQRLRRRGDAAGVDEWTARRGCVTLWQRRVIEWPTPHLELLAGRRPRAPETGDVERTGLTGAPRCLAVVRPPRGRPAYLQLGTYLVSDREREIELELRVADPDVLARVYFDDQVVLGRDSARRYLPGEMKARVKIAAGSSRVNIDLAALGGAFAVELVARDPATGARPEGFAWAEDPAVRPSGQHAAPAKYRAAPAPTWPAAHRLVDRLVVDTLRADAFLESGDSLAAQVAVSELRAGAPRFVPGLELAARVALESPGQPVALSKDTARRLWLEVLSVDPNGLRARLKLASQALADDDATGALKALGAEIDGAPVGGTAKGWRAELIRADALRVKSLEADADAAIDRAVAERPEACEVRLEAVRQDARKGRLKEARASAERLIACDGWSTALAEVAGDAGDHAAVVAERERLLARSPQDPGRHVDLGRALLSAGKRDGARKAFEQALALDRYARGARLALADLMASSGEVKPARRLLLEGLTLEPEARELASALVALGGDDDLEPWRIDGWKVIRDYEAAEKSGERKAYAAPAVLVLDRMVEIVRPDGGRLGLVHQIVKVLEKEGLEEYGQIQVPEGAELLAARTLKADGSAREAQALGTGGLTAPELAVGDYVETEYYIVTPSLPAWHGGFRGDRFTFASYGAPFDRSEFIVVVPEDMPVLWDIRGDAPKPTVERFDGWEVTTWLARRQQMVVPEPGGPPSVETMPSVMPYAGISLDRWRDWIGEQVYATRRADRGVIALAAELSRGKTPEASARAIHDWVLDNIDESGSLSDEPSVVLARRAGRRLVLMLALCKAAGLDAELWLGRSREDGLGTPPEGEIPEIAYPLIRLRLPKGDLWTDPTYRYAPLGWLPPELRDAPIVKVPDPEDKARAEAKLMLTPDQVSVPDRRTISLDVRLAANGSAEVVVEETYEGQGAAQLRDVLKDAAKEDLERDFEESTLGFWFPGSTLTELTFEQREDAYAPLVVRYRFRSPRYARVGPRGELAVALAPIQQLWQRRFVHMGARKTPLLLGGGGEQQVVTRVHLPAGYAVSGLPARFTREAKGKLARVEFSAASEGDTLVTSSTTSVVPFARVAPADYAAFVGFAAASDAAESRLIVMVKK